MTDPLLLYLLLSLMSIGPLKTKGPMLPLENEKLKQKIVLTDLCKNISVVEWKQDNIGSLQSKKSIDVIDKVCNKAVKYFYIFTNVKNKVIPSTTISLLPENSEYRSLNDSDFRFAFRSKNFDNGAIIPISGYFQRSADHIYVTNQVFIKKSIELEENSYFKKVLAHEIFHALSYKTGLFSKHVGNKDDEDEKLAQKFSLFFK